jgi:HSP20 family protein
MDLASRCSNENLNVSTAERLDDSSGLTSEAEREREAARGQAPRGLGEGRRGPSPTIHNQQETIMAMRDVIPWGRQSTWLPARHGTEERDPFLGLHRSVDRLFEDFFREGLPAIGGGRSLGWPQVEVNESEHDIRISAEVPGMSEKDVELLLDDGMLTIRGEKKSETDDKERGYSERFYGRFERRIPLPSNVKEEACKADFRDGVLTIRIPRSPDAERGRRIPINADTRH